MFGHKTSLDKFKKTENKSNIFSGNNGIKLEINKRRKTGKFINVWKLTCSWTTSRSKTKPKGNFKISSKNWKWKHNIPKIMGCSKRSSLRGKFITINVYVKKKKWSQINKLDLHLKEPEIKNKLSSN